MSDPDPATIGLALSAALNAGVSSVEDQVFLVSQCGKKFAVKSELVKASSEYFRGAFECGMIESGKSRCTTSIVSSCVYERIRNKESAVADLRHF
jgi:hypothetical protein